MEPPQDESPPDRRPGRPPTRLSWIGLALGLAGLAVAVLGLPGDGDAPSTPDATVETETTAESGPESGADTRAGWRERVAAAGRSVRELLPGAEDVAPDPGADGAGPASTASATEADAPAGRPTGGLAPYLPDPGPAGLGLAGLAFAICGWVRRERRRACQAAAAVSLLAITWEIAIAALFLVLVLTILGQAANIL